MKATILLFFFSLYAAAEARISVKDLPEIFYLHRKIDLPTRNAREVEAAQTATHRAVEELVAEARRYKLRFEELRFYHLDLKGNKIMEAGLQVYGPAAGMLKSGLVRRRPAGNYLFLEHDGGPSQKLDLQALMDPYLKEHRLRVKTPEAYHYKKSVIPRETNKVLFLIPVEKLP